jgi:predicted O-linked N-acetylglucosamine transferase (SPINDLY family)
LESCERALQLKPDYDFLYGRWLNARMKVCDWDDIANHFVRLNEKVERHEKASPPFPVLAIPSSPAVQRMAAEIWVENRHPVRRSLPTIPKQPRRDKIRIGYFSADFHEHATSRLMAGIFERHDRSRFQVTAFSFGPDANDAMRQRLSAALDGFIEVHAQSDSDVAMLARKLGIDIAVDLKGFTKDARTSIFALRAAPIQVNFLGYPGTMGPGISTTNCRYNAPDKSAYAGRLPACLTANSPTTPSVKVPKLFSREK